MNINIMFLSLLIVLVVVTGFLSPVEASDAHEQALLQRQVVAMESIAQSLRKCQCRP